MTLLLLLDMERASADAFASGLRDSSGRGRDRADFLVTVVADPPFTISRTALRSCNREEKGACGRRVELLAGGEVGDTDSKAGIRQWGGRERSERRTGRG